MGTRHQLRDLWPWGEGSIIVERRKSERVSTHGDIVLVAGELSLPVQMHDMSVDGCRVECDAATLATDDQVELTLIQEISITGTIRAKHGNTLNIAFNHPVNEVLLRYFRFDKNAVDKDIKPTDSFGRRVPPLSDPAARRAKIQAKSNG